GDAHDRGIDIIKVPLLSLCRVGSDRARAESRGCDRLDRRLVIVNGKHLAQWSIFVIVGRRLTFACRIVQLHAVNSAAVIQTSKLLTRTGRHTPHTEEVSLRRERLRGSVEIRNRREHERRQREREDERPPDSKRKAQQEREQEYDPGL